MKNLITYLKTLWSRVADSQRKEVGVISGEATIEHPFSTYSAPFGTCWQPSEMCRNARNAFNSRQRKCVGRNDGTYF